MQIPDPSVAEIMGGVGFDWVTIDMEHGGVSRHQLTYLCQALELQNTLTLVRISEGTRKECKQALDSGAGGVIVPMVQSATQLREIWDHCCWPPAGTRGVGFSRANLFGEHFESYKVEAQSPLFVAMIETKEALENIEEIVAVQQLDALLIGPYDLSADLGVLGNFGADEFRSAIDVIKKAATSAGLPVGIHIVNPDINQANDLIAEGYTFLPFSIDAVLLHSAARESLLGLKKSIGA